MEKLTTLLKKVQDLNADKKYDEVIDLLPIEVLEKHNNADLYAEKAAALGNLERYQECEIMAQKAIGIDKDCAKGYNSLGIISRSIHKDDLKAEEYFLKAISIDSSYSNPYYGLGNLYRDKKEYNKAEEFYMKTIEVDTLHEYPYNGLGSLYLNLKNYEKAKEFYEKALQINPTFGPPYYNLGLLNYSLKKYDLAKTYYKKYIHINTNSKNIYNKNAKSKIEEIDKILDNSSYEKIIGLVSKIKDLLLFTGECITHYSSISATQHLILNDSPLRLSEGSFLNDTSEGQELFDFLGIFPEAKTKCNEEIFTKRPFIGSFVDISKRNNLTLWRMYGKEDLVEAKGCSVTLNVSEFKQLIKEEINPSDDITTSKSDEIEFYRVAYRNNESFHFEGATSAHTEELQKLMENLKKEVRLFKKTNNSPQEEVDIIELLNSIAYLFKSVEYQYENEIRLVIKEAIGFVIQIDIDFDDFKPSSKPNKVYIELVSISKILKDITIGPKVDRAEEWASTFHYHLLSQGLKPEIHISKLPFK